MSERYIEQVLDGRALWTDIDDFVELWHTTHSGQSLHDFLGMTWDEYALWTEQPQALRLILAARERDEPVAALLNRIDGHAVAARGLSDHDARAVRTWLQATGRLPPR